MTVRTTTLFISQCPSQRENRKASHTRNVFTIPPPFIPNLYRIRSIRPPRRVERNRVRLARVRILTQLSILDDTRRGEAQQHKECDLHCGWCGGLTTCLSSTADFGGKEGRRSLSRRTPFVGASQPHIFFFLFLSVFFFLVCLAARYQNQVFGNPLLEFEVDLGLFLVGIGADCAERSR